MDDHLYASGLDGAAFPVTGSLSLWVKGDFSNSHTGRAIFDNYSTLRDHFFIRNVSSSGICQIQAYGNDAAAYITGGTFPLVDNQWNHIVITWDTANELFKAYHNSDLKISNSISVTAGQWVPDEQEVKFGVNSLGFMDEAAIWDAVLDADAVAAIYNNGRPFNLTNDFGDYDNASDLVGYWKMFDGAFDDKANGIVHDAHNPGYGSELWDGTDGDDANWVTYDNNTKAEVSGAVEITYVDHAYGAYHYFRDTKDLNTDLTVGATYKLTFQTKVNTGSANWQVNSDDGSSATIWLSEAITSTDFIPITIYFIPATTTTAFIRSFNMGTGEKLYIKNISLKKLNGYPAITAANATFSTDTPSKTPRGWALELDGADDYLDTGDAFQSTHRGSFSYSFWMKPDDGQPGANDTLIGTKNGDSTDWFGINLIDDGTINIIHEANNDPASYVTNAAVYADGTGYWKHICVTVTKGTNTSYIIYVDGAAVAGTLSNAVAEAAHAAWESTDNVYIGAINVDGTANNIFAGNIGHVAVWDVPLDASAVATIYGELWDGISGDDANWTIHGNNGLEEDDSAVKVTWNNNGDGAYIEFREAKDLNRDLTVGKRYTCSADIKVNTGSVELSVRHGSSNTNSIAVTDTDYVRRSITFTCENATNDRLELNAMSSGEIAWVKNISLLDVDKRKVTDLSVDDGDYDNSGDLVGYWKMGDGQDDDVEAGVIHDQNNPGFGAQIFNNNSFDTASTSIASGGWDLGDIDPSSGVDGDKWVVSGNGVAVNNKKFDEGDNDQPNLDQGTNMTVGKTYKYKVVVDSIEHGSVKLRGMASPYITMNAAGTYEGYFVATENSAYLRNIPGGAPAVSNVTVSHIELYELNGYPGITSGNPVFVKLPV